MSITDLYQTELWADGMEVDFDKLNNMQRFTRASITDQLLQYLVGGVANSGVTFPDFYTGGADAPNIWAYAVSPGAAYLVQGSANNKVRISAGTLLQKIANSSGTDSTFVPFTFDGTSSAEFTVSAGDATNPRVDLLQMKLQYVSTTPASVDFQDAVSRAITTVASTSTRRRLQCTLSVKQGTPNATAPVVPDPDPGFVAVGAVTVGPTWSGANFNFGTSAGINYNAKAFVHDLRMPMCVRAYDVDPRLYIIDGGWSVTDVGCVATSSSNGMKIIAPAIAGRVIALAIETTSITGASSIGTLISDHTSFSSILKFDLTIGGGGSGSVPFALDRPTLEGTPNTRSSVTITPSAVNKLSLPVWTSGYTTVQRDLSGTTPVNVGTFDRLAVGIFNAPSGKFVGRTTFYVAEGL